MKLNLFILNIICFPLILNAQTVAVRGTVSNQDMKPISFASILVKNSTKGTSANSEGVYNLQLPKGKHQIIFSAIGYKSVYRDVELEGETVINVSMETESYMLKDVIVNNNSEDPAYAIIRSAIRKRKIYLKQSEYICDVYIKGVQKLTKAPEKFFGQDIGKMTREIGLDSNRTGIIYQSESQSILRFTPPKNYHEEMISSKMAGSNRSFSFNRATDLIINFYENTQDFEDLSLRPFVSPIAENALFYYDYKLIGSTVENGELINKIQLLPKRNYDPAYRGYIYIVEDSWRIYATDFLMVKESNINILDTLKINQQYAQVNAKTWMPSVLKFEFNGGFLGFNFRGNFVGVYTNYNLQPTKRADLNETLRINAGVNKKDSTYWAKNRPIPLTNEEYDNYVKKDSIAKKRASKPYLDSLDQAGNKLKISKLLFGGYNPINRYKKVYYHVDGILNALSYNTVEGFVMDYGASYIKRIDTLNGKAFQWKGNLRYSFATKQFNPYTEVSIPLSLRQNLIFRLGANVVDLNNQGSLVTLGNTINSLFYERNFSKFYHKRYLEALYRFPIAGNIKTEFKVSYHSNKAMTNNSGYRIIDHKERFFTSNNPFSPTNDMILFNPYQNFTIGSKISYDFGNKYETLPSGKRYLPSRWPTLTIMAEKAINGVFGSDASYAMASVGIRKEDIKLGFIGKLSLSAETGKFFSTKELYYPDLKHFNGNRALSVIQKNNQFLFLDYYLYSTSSPYYQTHLSHNFSGFFLNKIPIIRKLKMEEIAGINYLNSNTLENYKEVYVGISYLGNKICYGWSFQGNQQQQSGIRIVFGL